MSPEKVPDSRVFYPFYTSPRIWGPVESPLEPEREIICPL
jgi:hypothetical protein